VISGIAFAFIRVEVRVRTEQAMTGIAERIEISPYSKESERRPDWAPYRGAVTEDESRRRSRLRGVSVLASFLLFSGITVVVARGHASLAESYGMSPESLLVAAWLIQGAAALFCFALAVRWLRS
jgi:hypothetical protein